MLTFSDKIGPICMKTLQPCRCSRHKLSRQVIKTLKHHLEGFFSPYEMLESENGASVCHTLSDQVLKSRRTTGSPPLHRNSPSSRWSIFSCLNTIYKPGSGRTKPTRRTGQNHRRKMSQRCGASEGNAPIYVQRSACLFIRCVIKRKLQHTVKSKEKDVLSSAFNCCRCK